MPPQSALGSKIRSLIVIRVINQLGAFTLSFLAVVAGAKSAALVLTTFAVFTIPSRWIGAWLTARHKPGLVVAGGLFGCAVAMLLLVPAHQLGLLAAAAAVLGLVFEIYEPASQELIAVESADDNRERAYNTMGISMSLAGVVAGLIAALLLPIGVRWLFVADATTCFLACLLAVYFFRDTARPKPPEPAERRRHTSLPRPLRLLTSVNICFAGAYLAILIFLPLGLLEAGTAKWMPGVLLASGAAVAFVIDRWCRPKLPQFGLANQGFWGCLLLMVVAIGLALSSGLWLFAIYFIWVVVDVLMTGLWSTLIAAAATPDERPRWFAVHGSAWGIAQILVPLPIVGLIRMGHTPLFAAGVVAAIGMGLAAILLKRFDSALAQVEQAHPSEPQRAVSS